MPKEPDSELAKADKALAKAHQSGEGIAEASLIRGTLLADEAAKAEAKARAKADKTVTTEGFQP